MGDIQCEFFEQVLDLDGIWQRSQLVQDVLGKKRRSGLDPISNQV